MAFKPQDPEFDSRVRSSFARQNAMQTLGVELAHVAPGEIELRMPFSDKYTQQHGFMHAGIIASALDSACGYAAFSLMPASAAVLSVEFKVNLLAPAQGDSFAFRARVIKAGRTLSVCDASAFGIADNRDERLIATMTSTIMTIVSHNSIRQ
jgi:uncharacterized protein (TIGR00369 family)